MLLSRMLSSTVFFNTERFSCFSSKAKRSLVPLVTPRPSQGHLAHRADLIAQSKPYRPQPHIHHLPPPPAYASQHKVHGYNSPHQQHADTQCQHEHVRLDVDVHFEPARSDCSRVCEAVCVVRRGKEGETVSEAGEAGVFDSDRS